MAKNEVKWRKKKWESEASRVRGAWYQATIRPTGWNKKEGLGVKFSTVSYRDF